MGKERKRGDWDAETGGGGRDLAGDPLAYECDRQPEKKEIERRKTGQLAQVTFDMSPAEKWRFFFPSTTIFFRGD